MTLIGFCHVSVSCYCKGCYHIFRIGYNGCNSYLGGDHTCPYCGTIEQVVRDDAFQFTIDTPGFIKSFLKDKPNKLKAYLKDQEELKRIQRLLKAHGDTPGWYPLEDYPMVEGSA